jgi:hypothetical protein
MRRRDFIIVFGSVAAASPAALRAQLRRDRPPTGSRKYGAR